MQAHVTCLYTGRDIFFVQEVAETDLETGRTDKALKQFPVLGAVADKDLQIREEGLDKILQAAGFEIRQPGCSACLAMNDDKIPAGKLAVSTSNRNFEGRQGPGARTILASPLTAAAAAVTGVITDPRELV